MHKFILVFVCLSLLAACGGGSTSSNAAPSSSSVSSSNVASFSSSSSVSSGTSAARVLLLETFDMASMPISLGLGAGSGVKLELVGGAESYGGAGKSLKATYASMPVGGSAYPWGGLNLQPYNSDHVYIRFRAKMPQYKHGIKFVKVFGQNLSAGSYANTTFALDYTGTPPISGSLNAVSFGDGSYLANDTANVISLDGSNASWAGRSYGLPGFSVSTPQGMSFASTDWGSNWHLFEFYVKFNSGNTAASEKNDGAIKLRIDGKIYVDAKGLFNRHYSNGPIDRIEILGWSQNGSVLELINGNWVRREVATPEFEVWYDNIEISLDGWNTTPL